MTITYPMCLVSILIQFKHLFRDLVDPYLQSYPTATITCEVNIDGRNIAWKSARFMVSKSHVILYLTKVLFC
jgi:hypothetical protein